MQSSRLDEELNHRINNFQELLDNSQDNVEETDNTNEQPKNMGDSILKVRSSINTQHNRLTINRI